MTKFFQLVTVAVLLTSPSTWALNYNKDIAVSRYSSWGVDPYKNLAAINVSKVYKNFKPQKQVVVAVIDTGIEFDHPFLKDNIYVVNNKANKFNYGMDFSQLTVSKTPSDLHGHGTHIAGIIKSVYPYVKLLNLKYYNPKASGQQNLDATVKALQYAIDMKVDIINYSGGGPEASVEELRLLKLAEKNNILVVAAAGNERSNIDDKRMAYYPASYGLKNIITVGSHDDSLNIIPSSNYGRNSVDVAAPGHRIRSSIPGKGAGYMTGTSQATAFVSGVAALIKAESPSLSATQIKQIIKSGSVKVKNFETKIMGASKLDAQKALLLSKKVVALQENRSFKRSISNVVVNENWGLKKINLPAKVFVDSNITIGVVDTGIDFNHPELKKSKWVNVNEKKDKKDNDQNGIVDDISGYDFVTQSSVIKDRHGHGTHVAGIIGGSKSLAPGVKMSSYNYFISSAKEFTNSLEYKNLLKTQGFVSELDKTKLMDKLSMKRTSQAFDLAINHKVKIINYSGGGYSADETEKQILLKAKEANILVIVAAGNGHEFTKQGIDMDVKENMKYYPCAYNLENVICVSGVDESLNTVPSANTGVELVHISAPGHKIYSTLPLIKSYGSLTGTSQATAFVSGMAALILSKKPSLTPSQVKALIVNSAKKIDGLKFHNLAGGIIDVSSALENVDNPKMLTLDKPVDQLLAEKFKNRAISELKENIEN